MRTKLIVVFAACCLACNSEKPPTAKGLRSVIVDDNGAAATDAVVERSAFLEVVLREGPDAIVAEYGAPNTVLDRGPGMTLWVYDKKTRDPKTGKVDDRVVLTLNMEAAGRGCALVTFPGKTQFGPNDLKKR